MNGSLAVDLDAIDFASLSHFDVAFGVARIAVAVLVAVRRCGARVRILSAWYFRSFAAFESGVSPSGVSPSAVFTSAVPASAVPGSAVPGSAVSGFVVPASAVFALAVFAPAVSA